MAGFEKIAKGEFFEMPNCRLPVNFVRYAEPKIFLQKTQKMQRHSDIYIRVRTPETMSSIK